MFSTRQIPTVSFKQLIYDLRTFENVQVLNMMRTVHCSVNGKEHFISGQKVVVIEVVLFDVM